MQQDNLTPRCFSRLMLMANYSHARRNLILDAFPGKANFVDFPGPEIARYG